MNRIHELMEMLMDLDFCPREDAVNVIAQRGPLRAEIGDDGSLTVYSMSTAFAFAEWTVRFDGTTPMSLIKATVEHALNAIDRDRVLTFDEATAAGLDGTGRDGDPRFPYTYMSLTPDERMGVDALNESEASR